MIGYYRTILLSLFRDLHLLSNDPKNVSLCYSIQERLIDYIRRTESRIRKLKKENKILQHALKNGRLPKENASALKEQIKYNHYKKDGYDQLLAIFRDVGDGVAFIYLDKWDIKPLCMSKEQAGFVSGEKGKLKKGLRLELAIFRMCKSYQVISIFNDITNSLRHGDITVPKYGIPLTIEAKSGSSKNERTERQSERSNKVLEYLMKDEAMDVYPGQENVTMYRQSLTMRERNHRKKLVKLLTKTLDSRQNITARIEEGLYYNISFGEEDIAKELSKLPKGKKWYASFVNMEKQLKQAYYPFPLSMRHPEALFEFYNGQFLITVLIDLGVIERELGKIGFNVEFYNDGVCFLHLENPATELKVKISNHFFGRIAAEFLSLGWMIEEFKQRVAKFPENYANLLDHFRPNHSQLVEVNLRN